MDPGGSPVGKGEGGHGLWSSEEGHVDQRGIRGGGQQEPDPAGPRGPPLGGLGSFRRHRGAIEGSKAEG